MSIILESNQMSRGKKRRKKKGLGVSLKLSKYIIQKFSFNSVLEGKEFYQNILCKSQL